MFAVFHFHGLYAIPPLGVLGGLCSVIVGLLYISILFPVTCKAVV